MLRRRVWHVGLRLRFVWLQACILATPPACSPVTAALLFKGPITEEGHQLLSRQRHVYILQFGKTQIAALDDATGRIDIDMAAQRRERNSSVATVPPLNAGFVFIATSWHVRRVDDGQVLSGRQSPHRTRCTRSP